MNLILFFNAKTQHGLDLPPVCQVEVESSGLMRGIPQIRQVAIFNYAHTIISYENDSTKPAHVLKWDLMHSGNPYPVPGTIVQLAATSIPTLTVEEFLVHFYEHE